MANVNDTANIRPAVERERDNLRTADIDVDDREAIENFVQHRRVHKTESGEYAATTERDDLNRLRLSAERADTPLTVMGIDDLNRLLDTLTREAPPKDENGRTWRSEKYDGIEPGTDGYGWGITTGIDAYTRVLRPFFRWLDAHDDYGDYGWWEQVKTGNVSFPEPRERRFPTREEIEAIKRAAGQRGTLRDVALVAFFAESAVRRTLGAQLTVGCLDLTGEALAHAPGAFRPNPEGEAQKGVEVKWYPLYDSVAELRTWVNRYHPDPENDDAPLWTHARYDDFDDPTEAAIKGRQIGRVFKKFAREAGIDTDEVEVKPHAFRHAAVGRWKEQGYTLSQVQRRTAWKDKAAAEMWAQYGDPDDSALDAGIAEREGREPAAEDGEADESAAKPEPWTCGNCNTSDIVSPHCPQCGAAPGASPQTALAMLLNSALVEGDADAIDALAEKVAGHMSPEKVASIAEANAANVAEVRDADAEGD